MKKFALLIVLMILAMACISEKETPQTPPLPPNGTPAVTTPPQTTPAPTTQPPTTPPPTTPTETEAPKKSLGEVLDPICSDGVWALYALPDDDSIKHKLFDDGDIFVHEFETEDAVTQAWLTKEFKQIKVVIRDEDEVYCIDTSTFINPTETYSS